MSKKTVAYRHMTEKEFDGIKVMIQHGLTNRQVSYLSKRSLATVSYVKRAENFSDYRSVVADVQVRANERKTGNTPVEQVEVSTEVVEQVDTSPTELSRIADALEALVKAWETQPTKKRLF